MATRNKWEARLYTLAEGAYLADPIIDGLRYRRRRGGIFAQYRWKDPHTHKWEAVSLGAVSGGPWAKQHGGDLKLRPGQRPHSVIREKAAEIAKKLDRGIDPRSGEGLEGLSLKIALERYTADLKQRKVIGERQITSLLERELLTPLGNRPLDTLTRKMLVDRIDSVAKGGRPGAARELRTRAGVFLEWCVSKGYIEASPLGGYRRPRKTKAEKLAEIEKARRLGDHELRAFWTASEAAGWPFGVYLQTLLLTGQRRSETVQMRWRDLDLEEGTWTIPAEVTKSGREHKVPLPAVLVAMLRARREELGDSATPNAYVFAGRKKRAMTGWNKRLRKVRESGDGKTLPHWTLHDLRRTFRSGLHELGVDEEVSEMMLNHQPNEELVKRYNKAELWGRRRAAAEMWAEHVMRHTGSPEPAPTANSDNVIPMRVASRA